MYENMKQRSPNVSPTNKEPTTQCTSPFNDNNELNTPQDMKTKRKVKYRSYYLYVYIMFSLLIGISIYVLLTHLHHFHVHENETNIIHIHKNETNIIHVHKNETNSIHIQKNETKEEVSTKKNLYLHVGPGKMATTTIQNAMERDEAILQQDGYCTKKPHQILRTKDVNKIQSHPSWSLLLTKLDECHEQNQHVLLSSEDMGLIDSHIWDTLLRPAFSRWNVIILVGYRRYYEWMPSVYFELYHQFDNIPPIDHFVRKDKRPEILYTDNYLKHWKSLIQQHDNNDTKEEDEEEEDVKNANEEMEHLEKRHETSTSSSNAGTRIEIDTTQVNQHTIPFEYLVYNLHLDQNVLKTLYCHVLPTTYQTCQKYSNERPHHDNTGYSIEYDRLIIAASNQNKLDGLFNEIASTSTSTSTTSTTTSSSNTIEGQELHNLARVLEDLWENDWNKTINHFPRDCLSNDEIKELFDKSMQWEESLVPEYYMKHVLPHMDHVKQEFYDMAKIKLCSVNVEKVVQDDKYLKLWNGLVESKNRMTV